MDMFFFCLRKLLDIFLANLNIYILGVSKYTCFKEDIYCLASEKFFDISEKPLAFNTKQEH